MPTAIRSWSWADHVIININATHTCYDPILVKFLYDVVMYLVSSIFLSFGWVRINVISELNPEVSYVTDVTVSHFAYGLVIFSEVHLYTAIFQTAAIAAAI